MSPPPVRWLTFVVACLVMVYGLYAPTEPRLPVGFTYIDKLGHLGVFFLVAVTGRWVGIRWQVLAPLLVAQAVVSEIVQALFEVGRDGDVWDSVADLIGTALGLGGWEAVQRWRRRRRQPVPAGHPGHRGG